MSFISDSVHLVTHIRLQHLRCWDVQAPASLRKSALRTTCTVIQGPPGTGKTHVTRQTVKIIHWTLDLPGSEVWEPQKNDQNEIKHAQASKQVRQILIWHSLYAPARQYIYNMKICSPPDASTRITEEVSDCLKLNKIHQIAVLREKDACRTTCICMLCIYICIHTFIYLLPTLPTIHGRLQSSWSTNLKSGCVGEVLIFKML